MTESCGLEILYINYWSNIVRNCAF